MELRVDTSDKRFMVTREAQPKTDFATGAQKADRSTGALLWSVQLMALDSSGGEIITVTVDGEPTLAVGQYVTVEGLVALPWTSKDGQKSGVAFRAARLTLAKPQSVASSPSSAA